MESIKHIMSLQPADMQNAEQFEQSFVDNAYHLVQVIGMLQKSDWFKWSTVNTKSCFKGWR